MAAVSLFTFQEQTVSYFVYGYTTAQSLLQWVFWPWLALPARTLDSTASPGSPWQPCTATDHQGRIQVPNTNLHCLLAYVLMMGSKPHSAIPLVYCRPLSSAWSYFPTKALLFLWLQAKAQKVWHYTLCRSSSYHKRGRPLSSQLPSAPDQIYTLHHVIQDPGAITSSAYYENVTICSASCSLTVSRPIQADTWITRHPL